MDLLRRCGKVIIPDVRNDENNIISQLHLFWQKLHNLIIDNKRISDHCNNSDFNINKPFDLAQNFVIKTFQQVVIEDFLYNILDIDVYSAYIKKINEKTGDLFIYSKSHKVKKTPLEFSLAAFRFGHSLIRSSYKINDRKKGRKPFDLSELFNPKHKRIDVTKIVEWERFFSKIKGNDTMFANKIDDSIVNPMKKIPNQRDHSIIKMNLKIGKEKKLPSGIQVLKYIRNNYKESAIALKLDRNNYKEIEYVKFPEYSKITSLENIPLWLYILLEAKNHGVNDRLGKLGSTIVAEVIFKSILQAKTSVLKERELYYPTDKTIERLNSMLLSCSIDSNQLFDGFLDDFRRFKMMDLINFVNNKLK